MVTRDQLLKAKKGIVALIRDQAEKRLASQCAFADALDEKGGAFLTASASLAAASSAVVAAGLAVDVNALPLVVGAGVATAAFTAAAVFAAWSLRSAGFHSVGWYPQDFSEDIDGDLSLTEIDVDITLALHHRLSENKAILANRGDRLNWSSYVLLGGPVAAVIASLLAAS